MICIYKHSSSLPLPVDPNSCNNTSGLLSFITNMKTFATATVLLASLAAARKCKPATYRCESNQRAWDVCNTSGDWVVRLSSRSLL